MAKNKKQQPEKIQQKPVEIVEITKEDDELLGTPPKEKELIGYHPVTGEEIWK
jgi:hypothetical protein